MAHYSKQQEQAIMDALEEAGATLPCPRCGHDKFQLLPGCFVQHLVANPYDPPSISDGNSPGVAIVGTACDRCGFIAYHAMRRLGLDKAAES
jgi:ribosomal protein L37E